MNKLLECTRGPWEAARPSARGTGHNWTIRANGTVCVAESGRWLNSDPHTESRANAALIAAAYDHALIWWATEHSDDFDIIKEKPGDEYILLGGAGQNQATIDPSGHLFGPSLAIDPFGFPVLTDDLRARLIAGMEATR